MPAKAGIQWFFLNCKLWIPACAGMTVPGSLFIYLANRASLFALVSDCIIVLDKIDFLHKKKHPLFSNNFSILINLK